MSFVDVIILALIVVLVAVLVYFNLIKNKGSACLSCGVDSKCNSITKESITEYYYKQINLENEQIQE